MPIKKTPIKTIDAVIAFIKENNLGPTQFFYFGDEKEKRKYDEIEKNRLRNILNICNDLVNKKISIDSIEDSLKRQEKLSDSLSKEFSKVIRDSLSEENQTEQTEKNESVEDKKDLSSGQIIQSKNSIFSKMIEKK